MLGTLIKKFAKIQVTLALVQEGEPLLSHIKKFSNEKVNKRDEREDGHLVFIWWIFTLALFFVVKTRAQTTMSMKNNWRQLNKKNSAQFQDNLLLQVLR